MDEGSMLTVREVPAEVVGVDVLEARGSVETGANLRDQVLAPGRSTDAPSRDQIAEPAAWFQVEVTERSGRVEVRVDQSISAAAIKALQFLGDGSTGESPFDHELCCTDGPEAKHLGQQEARAIAPEFVDKIGPCLDGAPSPGVEHPHDTIIIKGVHRCLTTATQQPRRSRTEATQHLS